MIFSERIKAEAEFVAWAKETNVVIGAHGVFVWLMNTDEGKTVLKKLYSSLNKMDPNEKPVFCEDCANYSLCNSIYPFQLNKHGKCPAHAPKKP